MAEEPDALETKRRWKGPTMTQTVERLDIDVDAQFGHYRELVEKHRVLKLRMEKAEAEKRSVRERVFQRVMEEYSRELQHLESEIEPLSRSLQSARSTIQDQIKDIDLQLEENKDRIDEIAFRGRVGEFDASAADELRTPLADECSRLVRRRQQLTETLARMDARETARAADPPKPEPAPRREVRVAPRATEHPPKPERREAIEPGPARAEPAPERTESAPARRKLDHPEHRASSDGTSGEGDAFVDPTEWVGEFVKDEHPEPAESKFEGDPLFCTSGGAVGETRRTAAGNEATEDPLAGLADPCEENMAPSADTGSQANARTAKDTAYGGLPVLTITQGPGAGKTLPLLPMTMTLGREVDNNIELKDVDVARYHACISFEAGHYVIQDLEGSSGTFVNGQKVSKAPLSPGSTIRVGGTELHFDLG
jgi:TolA-binding protein